MKLLKFIVGLFTLASLALVYLVITTPQLPLVIQLFWLPFITVASLVIGSCVEEISTQEAASRYRDELEAKLK